MSKNPLNSEKKQNIFVSSSQELKKVPALAACAMFAALAMILNSVASISIGPYIKIGFSAIPNQLVDYLFGPVTGSLFAGVLDIVKYVLKPDGAFFFGFTFNAMLAAFIYGCFYYKKKLTLWRVLLAKLIVILVVNVFLNTLWLDMLYGKGFLVLLPARAVKNLIMWPIDSVIFFALTRLIEQTGVFRMFRTAAR
ncbi:MAG TPA: folate family ECF transporter S component [Candidatus Fusicatenibacter intestinigallinarum]|uniref:Folate family ECF transporter S component n=1 Tax=Candidatus Fusicatenibacter intestinigallinarum TaxID=2838598 RepID=A0A9D2NBB0_9FIRM|nr:folate family ECF transporter S component [Candidatus Fusicatenibacter intestinigallinarum]